jgi:hypothetical protein
MSGEKMVGLVKQAVSEGRWAIFTFHGVDEGHLPVAEEALRTLCAYLARERHRIWTAPVVAVARHVKGWREGW